MDYFLMTAPCGLDCFNCQFFLANDNQEARKEVEKLSERLKIPFEIMLCRGCRNHRGRIPLLQHMFGKKHRCAAYECSTHSQRVDFCGECEEFPCDHLHPCADKANVLPHNIKVFNLCLINRLGLEEWAKSKAAKVRKDYFTKPWSLAK